jgi:uncharacterized damage-inducible protein DinB
MSTTIALAFTFEEMLAAQHVELGRWQEWFAQQPDTLLDLRVDIAKAEDLRSALFHIFLVELSFAEALNEMRDPNASRADLLALPHATFDDLFAIHQRAFSLLKQWAERATPEDAAKLFVRGELRVSRKKCFIQVMEHTLRHFAQLSVALRKAGHPTDWMHDFIFNPSMS